MAHFATDLILTELAKESGVEWDVLQERVNVGAADFKTALEELEGEGAVARGGHDGSLIYLADASAGAADLTPPPDPPPPPSAGAEPPAPPSGPGLEADLKLASTAGALLVQEARKTGKDLRVNARVRYVEHGNGLKEVVEVLEVYGIDLA